jgi:enoyl-CoA hydratase
MTFSFIETSQHGNVAVITFNRPQSLNALCRGLILELNTALDRAEQDENTNVIVLAGSERAFAAGADIKEMKDLTFSDLAADDFIAKWEHVTRCRKPVIAAVSGFALGGGCELSMMCDIIYAAESAKFSQPEITIGTMPGAGGSQRLTQLVGKQKAMELCMTGRMIDAVEAERIGLVSRIFPQATFLDDVLKEAQKIASFSKPVIAMIKEAVKSASEAQIASGIRHERALFHSTFALDDRQEGMAAFAEKRTASFRHR